MRRAGLLALCALGLACSSTPGGRMCPTQSPDMDILQAVLNGQVAVAEGLKRVALSEGWPIQGCTGYAFLFPGPDTDRVPYSVESPSGAFPRVALNTGSGLAWGIVPIQFPEGATYQYVDVQGRVLPDAWSRVFTFDGGAQVSVVRPNAAAHLERWPALGDAAGTIPGREVKVWVPAQAPSRVLYAHDGQEAFGPALDLPARAGPATLVVGIDAVAATRLQEYQAAADLAPDGGPMGERSVAYADYVQNVVRGLVEAHYFVAADAGRPARSAVLGCGAGGSAALKSPVRFPGTWDLVAGISGDYGAGHYRADNRTLYRQVADLDACPAAAFFLGVGGVVPDGGCQDLDGDAFWDDVPGAPDGTCQTLQLQRSLLALGCGARVTVEHLDGGERCGATARALVPGIFSRLEAP